MPSVVLPSHDDAALKGLGRASRERGVPSGWPGTYVPNLSEWKPGDIVLMEATGFVGMFIKARQAGSANMAAALANRWSHAAIYVGNGVLVHAVHPAGVQQCSVWTYCHHRALTVRRIDDPAIASAEIAKIAGCAVSHIGEPYSVVEVVMAALGWPYSQKPHDASLYCSTFAGLVVAEATGVELASDPQWQPLFPSTLAAHSELSAVPLEWRNI